MKTYRNLQACTLTITLAVCLLIAVRAIADLPKRALAATDDEPSASGMIGSHYVSSVASVTNNVVIDHDSVDADTIPQTWLDQARVLDTFFTHKSVGNNILDGIADLQTQDPVRYSIVVDYGSGNGTGITHYQVGSNGDPQSKIDGFDNIIRNRPAHDVAFMKFCPGDFPPWTTVSPEDVWEAYRDMMQDLQADYPDVIFVWWTLPLTTQSDNRGNAEKAVFNALVRNYVAVYGGVLFDIADVESHDPSGNPIIGPTGHEAMYDDYSTDGAHLNEAGRQRVARALWWLLARAAGWASADDWISVTAVNDVVSIHPGETATYTLSVTASEEFTAPVTLSLQGAPPDGLVSLEPNPVSPPGASQLTISTTASTQVGTYAMTVTGASGQISDTTSLTLIVEPTSSDPVLYLLAQPTVRSILPGDAAVYTLSVTASEGFTAPVTLSLQGAPLNGLVSFEPNPTSPPGISQLTITTTASTTAGTYAITTIGTSGQMSATASLTLIIEPTSTDPVLYLLAQPIVRTILPGDTATYTLSVTASEGFTAPVTLSLKGAPSGTGTFASFDPNPVTPPGDSQLHDATAASTRVGTYTMTVTGSSCQVTSTTPLTLIVKPVLNLTAQPDVHTVLAGDSAAYTLSVTASEGFTAPVTLSLKGAPSGTGTFASFDPNPVTPPGDSQLQIATTASTRVGTYTMTVTGSSCQVTGTTSLTLIVKSVLNLTAQPDVHIVLAGDSAAYNLTVTASEGFTAPVTLTLQGVPSGTGTFASFDPNPVTPPGNSQLHVATTASTRTGIYPMTVTGTSGTLTDTADLNLIVTSLTPSFTLGISPTTHTARPYQQVSFAASINGVNGFSQPVTLTALGLPARVGAAWSINPVEPDNPATLTLSVPGSPPFGKHSFYVIATTNTQAVAQDITLIIETFKIYLPTILKNYP